ISRTRILRASPWPCKNCRCKTVKSTMRHNKAPSKMKKNSETVNNRAKCPFCIISFATQTFLYREANAYAVFLQLTAPHAQALPNLPAQELIAPIAIAIDGLDVQVAVTD